MNIICIIPARLAATRLPEKILQPLNGRPLLEQTWRAAMNVPQFSQVIIALDSQKTAALVESFGGNYVFTDPTLPSGTHRLLAASHELSGDIWVNWQADEPFIVPAMITDLLQDIQTKSAQCWTLKTKITHEAEITDPHTVKVVTGQKNKALYFSRSPIPYYRNTPPNGGVYYKHVGLYAYNSAALNVIANLPPCPLAQAESLEQLQFLSHDLPIMVHETAYSVHGIDTLHDLQRAEQR